MIGLRAADALQKDLDIATGMVSSKTVQWSRHTVKQQILLVRDGHGIPDPNSKNCFRRWSDNGNDVWQPLTCSSGRHNIL